MSDIYSIPVTTKNGEQTTLEAYRGKTLLIVNTASACGFTPQFEGLETLYQTYQDQGLEILGFPCNQFGGQDPGSQEEIESFCKVNYGVTFPIFKKIEVNGDNEAPLFTWLKSKAKGVLGSRKIKWNFTKFLVDPSGTIVKRYAPMTKPGKISADIKKLLGAD
ncbi:glutathione peroxidase [Emcibacter nanhaiensis]|uniref:Glutathione peroxidase n=1 Tax=Emcibacter nanhaiensis TaxID=1505037 RepID=A0A501PGK7_9PROT|nr:glutathione peroxidase [Emcibacter nanhaiensis]TPD59152.1 glutathione peroxidase [Emcibacter nanhaiensis]